MQIERKQDLSVCYWLEDVVFSDMGDIVTVVDGYPTDGLTLPTVSVDWKDISVRPYELGNRYGLDFRIYYLDVFALNKSQRDDFSYRIKNELASNIPVYDYDEGFPPDVSPTQLGVLVPSQITIKPVRIMAGLVERLYYRATVSFVATYTT